MTRRPANLLMRAACVLACLLAVLPARGADVIYPSAGGTLADGGSAGQYDGIVDSWNWEFGPTGFAGAVTLTTETPDSAVEHRIVCEYDLRDVSLTSQLEATLTFTTRGARAVPFPDVQLHVYSYPADLIETPGDFSAGPMTLQKVVTVTAMQTPRIEKIDVTALVTTALASGARKLAFRFQIDPETPHVTNQVFIDALDAEPATKPYLTIRSTFPGDADNDGDADLADFAVLTDCLGGPGTPPVPTRSGMAISDCLRVFDRDTDTDVDLSDLASFLDGCTEE